MKYEIIFSKRKTVSLQIKDGELVVRAPIGMKDEDVRRIVEKHTRWIERTLEKQRRALTRAPELSEEKIKALRLEAKEYFKSQIEKYSKIMGLKYGRMTITSAKKRFGSCSSRGDICFSYRLMLYPEAAREYVVVHELAHLIEMNHSARFYSIVEKYLPDYKERRNMLKG